MVRAGRANYGPAMRLLAIAATLCSAAHANAGTLKVVGGEGWPEVGGGWSQAGREYFVATEKRHHFIEMSNLPKNLDADLSVSLEFYHSYKRVPPSLQMTPCKSNIYLINENDPTASRLQRSFVKSQEWHTHEIVVDHRDCLTRNKLAYNVLLHDEGDMFAWRLMTVKSVRAAPTTTTTEAASVTELTEQPTERITEPPTEPPTEPSGPTELVTDPTTTTTTTTTTTERPSITEAQTESTTRTASEPSSSAATTESSSAATTELRSEPSTTEAPAQRVEPSTESPNIKPPPARTTERPVKPETPASSLVSSVSTDRPFDFLEDLDNPVQSRFKRELTSTPVSTSSSSSSSVFVDESCRPSSCDRNKFQMARFSSILAGVPALPFGMGVAGGKPESKYYLNLRNQPLKMKLSGQRSGGHQLTEVDPCLKFKLFMDANSELELLLERASGEPRLLELIDRKLGHPKAGTWDSFERCMSDYMPRLSDDELTGNNAIQLAFRARPANESNANRRIAVLVDGATPSQVGYLRKLHPIQSYLPDLRQLKVASDLDKYWLLGNARATPEARPQVQLGDNQDKSLIISNIDSNRQTFDLTSRWMQIKSAEILELPVLFVYRAPKPDWLERINFEYQRAGDPSDSWISQVAYRALPTGSAGASSSGNTSVATPTEASNQLIDLPMRVRGIDDKEFRVRVRHHLKSAMSLASNRQPLSLKVSSLAFADACSYKKNYCSNGGQCRPIGPAQAECACAPGFSGRFCERAHPCDMLYGPGQQTGSQVCSSIGARCVTSLPVLRCEWPRDKYYECKALYTLNSSSGQVEEVGVTQATPTQSSTTTTNAGNILSLVGGGGAGPNLDQLPVDEQLARLKEVVTQQAKLIIILAVFMLSVLVFAIVLVGSMISRLRKSTQRLKRSQGEVHELARRVGGNGSVMTSSFGRASGAKTVAYNNSAFDVE